MKGFWLGLRSQFVLAISVFTLFVMVVVVAAVQRQQGQMLEREIRERGLTLARTLAATCIEPMELPERTLSIMLLVKEVIQQSDNPDAAKGLYATSSMAQLILQELRPGAKEDTAKVTNEGVLFAKVVGTEGKIIAVADAIKPQAQWFDEIDKPFIPSLQTSPLASGTLETVSDSPDNNGMYVIAVPILKRAMEGAPGELAEAGPGAKSPAKGKAGTGKAAEAEQVAAGGELAAGLADGAPAAFLGSVYLGVSKGLVRRAIAHAVARVIQIAVVFVLLGIGVAFLIAQLFVRPIHQLRDAVKAVSAGDFSVRVRTKQLDEIGALADSFNEMTAGLGEKELIGSAFGAYVSKDVLDEILKNPDAMKVGGSRKTITMLCSDVRGFTSMSEKLSPEQVVNIINRYLDTEAKLVAEFKGYLDRFVGDAVRSVFGVPMGKPDDAERAVRCALAIKEAVVELQGELAAEGLPSPRVGVGLDSGHVIAGNLGAPGVKLDYTVIGEPVSTAETLVDAARDPEAVGAQIIVSERTKDLVKGKFEFKELSPLELPGRSAPMRVFEVISASPGAGR